MKFHPEIPVFGDKSYRGDCAIEAAEQITFFGVLRKHYPEIGSIAIHTRNEGKRTLNQAQRHKAEGMVTGAPDIVIPCSPPILIELKRRDHTKSRWQDGQIEYLLAAKAQGAHVCVALGWEAAIEAVKAFTSERD